jgi:hypothetical protein
METPETTEPLSAIAPWAAWCAQDYSGPAGSSYARWVLAQVLPFGTNRTWAAEKNQAKFRRARVVFSGEFGAAKRQVWR